MNIIVLGTAVILILLILILILPFLPITHADRLCSVDFLSGIPNITCELDRHIHHDDSCNIMPDVLHEQYFNTTGFDGYYLFSSNVYLNGKAMNGTVTGSYKDVKICQFDVEKNDTFTGYCSIPIELQHEFIDVSNHTYGHWQYFISKRFVG